MKKYLICLLGAGLLVSCRTHKSVIDQGAPVSESASTSKTEPKIVMPKETDMSGKLRFTALQQGAQRASTGGNIRMKRDEIIQVRLVALIVEIGRLEMTPEYLLVQDRMNRQYVRVRWADVPQLQESRADFNTLQQLFWGEYPGAEKGLTLKLNSTTSLRLDYAKWQKLGKQRFPGQMTLTIQTGQKNYGGIFDYSNLEAEDHVKIEPTTISSSYKQVELEQILKQLIR